MSARCPYTTTVLTDRRTRLGDKALELHKFSSSALPSPRQSLQDLYNHWVEHQALANSPSFRTRKRSPDRGVTTRHPESPGRGSVRRRDIAHLSVHQYAKRSVPHELYIDAAWKIETEIRRSRSEAKSSVVQPTLLVLSDDSSGFGLSDLLDHAAASKIRVFVGVDDLLAGKESALNGGEMEGEAAKSLKHSQATVSGFHEATFNAMPLKTRVENTKSFLRDLTVTARFADGLVFTGSSNVGRLLALLSAQGRNGKRLFYSADVRWFPTTRYL